MNAGSSDGLDRRRAISASDARTSPPVIPIVEPSDQSPDLVLMTHVTHIVTPNGRFSTNAKPSVNARYTPDQPMFQPATENGRSG